MKFRISIWILWTTLACTTAPNIEDTITPPALSFVRSPNGVYELEDTAALLWRNNTTSLTVEAFYFYYTIFACPETKQKQRRSMEKNSTAKSLSFIYEIAEPATLLNLNTHPPYCQQPKRYHSYAVPIIRSENRYVIDPKLMKGNPKRQEFSIGYEVADDTKKLSGEGLPGMERFEDMAEGSGWLETYKVVYDTENFIARQVSYELNFFGASETAPGNCGSFDVGRVHKFFDDVVLLNAYRKGAQIGVRRGSMRDVVRPKRRPSQSVNTAVVSTLPSSSAQSEQHKKQRVAVEPKGAPPTEDEPEDNDEIELIVNTHSPWDSRDYFGVKLPTASRNSNTIIPNSNTESELSKSTELPGAGTTAIDESGDEYMVPQQLAPIEYFDVFAVQWSTCSHLNVVPMWISLANGPWKRVDKAIRKMLYVIDKLSIIAGTHGELQLPKRNEPNQYQNVSLRSNEKKILIPELFYKFVVHKVPFAVPSSELLSYGIIIVMHNNFGVPTRRICPNDSANLCAQYGWDVGSEPYCCRPSTRILELLDIMSYSSPVNDFNLNSVLVKITEAGERVVQNYNQFQFKQYPVVAKKKGKTKKLNDIYF